MQQKVKPIPFYLQVLTFFGDIIRRQKPLSISKKVLEYAYGQIRQAENFLQRLAVV